MHYLEKGSIRLRGVLEVGLPTYWQAWLGKQSVFGAQHEANLEGSKDVLVPLFGLEGTGSGNAFGELIERNPQIITTKNRHI